MADEFVGAGACRPCHAAQYAQQSASGHARSLSRVKDHPLAASFLDAIAARGPAVEWAFGAGGQAVTFVSRVDGDSYLEHHLSYFTALKKLAPTPGHAGKPEPGVLYRTFGAEAGILRCFQCHSTGGLRVVEGNAVEPAELGVRCENCHGAGGAHARSPLKENIHRPLPEELNQMCGSCHRKPAAAGEDTDFSNPWNARHQPLSFSRSKCYVKSAGNLSCVNCHSPHGGPVKPACGGCHPSPKHPAGVGISSKSCVKCHMPDVKPVEGLKFANHWIGIYRAGETLIPSRR